MLGTAFIVTKKDKGNDREWGGLKGLNFPLPFPLWKSSLGSVDWVQ